MKRKPIIFLVFALLILFLTSNSLAAVWVEDIIGQGEKWETGVYIQDSEKEGYVVLIVGGVHGSEPAGAIAAKELLDEIFLEKGKIVMVPEANRQALELKLRFPPHGEDLNRAFTGKEPESWTDQLAMELYNLLARHSVDLIFDLHEARDFYRINPESVGQTIIFNGHTEEILLAWEIADIINPFLLPLERFIILSPTVEDSLTRRAYEDLGLTTFIIETTIKQPMEVRVKQQKMVVLTALKLLGLIEDFAIEDFGQ